MTCAQTPPLHAGEYDADQLHCKLYAIAGDVDCSVLTCTPDNNAVRRRLSVIIEQFFPMLFLGN